MKASTAQDYRERVVRTLLYIQQHLDEELDYAALASVAAFSPFHFHRVFRGICGETVTQHIRRLRLERAARDLRDGDRAVTDIAFEAGFEAHESFTRAFAKRFGMPPSHYRDIPPVEILQLPPVRVLFLRHTGPYDQVGTTWGRLMMWAGMRGLLGPGMRLLGISYEDPDVTPPDQLRYDACVVVSRPVEPEGEFGVTEVSGGTYAVATHKGAYEKLSDTYRQLFGGWLPDSGRSLRDVPCFEEYLNSPQFVRPEELLTRIHIPLED